MTEADRPPPPPIRYSKIDEDVEEPVGSAKIKLMDLENICDEEDIPTCILYFGEPHNKLICTCIEKVTYSNRGTLVIDIKTGRLDERNYMLNSTFVLKLTDEILITTNRQGCECGKDFCSFSISDRPYFSKCLKGISERSGDDDEKIFLFRGARINDDYFVIASSATFKIISYSLGRCVSTFHGFMFFNEARFRPSILHENHFYLSTLGSYLPSQMNLISIEKEAIVKRIENCGWYVTFEVFLNSKKEEILVCLRNFDSKIKIINTSDKNNHSDCFIKLKKEKRRRRMPMVERKVLNHMTSCFLLENRYFFAGSNFGDFALYDISVNSKMADKRYRPDLSEQMKNFTPPDLRMLGYADRGFDPVNHLKKIEYLVCCGRRADNSVDFAFLEIERDDGEGNNKWSLRIGSIVGLANYGNEAEADRSERVEFLKSYGSPDMIEVVHNSVLIFRVFKTFLIL